MSDKRAKRGGASRLLHWIGGAAPALAAAYLAMPEPRKPEPGAPEPAVSPATAAEARVRLDLGGQEWVVPGKGRGKPSERRAPERPSGQPAELEPEYERVERARWPYWPWVWAGLFVAGLAAWLLTLFVGSYRERAWVAVLVNFLYFTPMAAGMVTWTAVVIAGKGNWMGGAKRAGLMGILFVPGSFIAYLWAWIGWRYWAGWIRYDDLNNAAWVNTPFIFARGAVALFVFWLVAYLYVRQARDGRPRGLAGGFVLIYCLAFSFIAYDLVAALDPHWPSTLFGGYFFISSMQLALAAWTLLAIVRAPSGRLTPTRDFAKLLVAFGIMTTYMMFAQLLPIWYEQLPDEVRYVIPRLQVSAWRWMSVAVVGIAYMGPLVFLLPRRVKGSAAYVGAASGLILATLWFERYWMVGPALGNQVVFGLPEISATAAFLGAFAFPISLSNRRAPVATVRRRDG